MKRSAAFILLFFTLTLVHGQEYGDVGAQDLLIEDEDEEKPAQDHLLTQPTVTQPPPPPPPPPSPSTRSPVPLKRQKLRRTSPKIQTTTQQIQPSVKINDKEEDQCSNRIDIVSPFSCTNCTTDDHCRKGQFVCCSVPYLITPIILQTSSNPDRKCCVIKRPLTTTISGPVTTTASPPVV